MDNLIYWYQDDSCFGYTYVVYTTKKIIDQIGYIPFYFEDAKHFSKIGSIVVIVYHKNNIQQYSSYIYNKSTNDYWTKKINIRQNIDYQNRYSLNICI